jgi:hypothetical protein
MLRRTSLIAVVAASLLSGCVNDGSVPDKHPITFEQAVPAGGPSQSVAKQVLSEWLVNNYPDGGSAKDVSVGPVRFARVLYPFPDQDYFTCAVFTAKNKYGTYMPPEYVIMTMRIYKAEDGWKPALVKPNAYSAYRQYCINQPHS